MGLNKTNLGITMPPPPCLVISDGGATGITWSAQPAGVTELYGSTANRVYLDLRSAKMVRLWARVLTAGAGGAILRAQYSIDGGSTFFYFSDPAYAGPQCAISGTGSQQSEWSVITAAPIAQDCRVRIVGVAGNGVASPVLGNIGLQFA